ncbi:MAG: hypothetical protein JSW26_07130 [Desulfobacterales bacterium]|nr:MAG: hypothetical protein JSW26_07130 [Desulfobacterales bacterium]
MTGSSKESKNVLNKQVGLISLFMISLALLIGCSGNYGSLKRNQQVQEEFETNRLPMEYRYYYYGYDTYPYVIFGIEPKFEMNSKMWRMTAPDTDEFKAMTGAVWQDYGYYKFGADILDPNGKKVGIFYSAIPETTVKFVADNQIVVIPHTPFLWGPGDGDRTP